MSKHIYYKHRGDSIEALDKENKVVATGKRILFTDFSDTEEGIVHGSIMFEANVPDAHLLIDTIVVSGMNDNDEVFYEVLEEASLWDEAYGPDKNHYSFTAEQRKSYGENEYE